VNKSSLRSVYIVMRPCLVLLYVCFVMRTINYCCSCSFYTATLYIELSPIYSMHATALGVCAGLAKCEQQNDQDNSAGARIEVYWQNVVWSRTVQLCRYFVSTRWGTFPQVCRGTLTLLPNVGRLLWACCIDVDVVARRGPSTRRFREFREASMEAASRGVGCCLIEEPRKRIKKLVTPEARQNRVFGEQKALNGSLQNFACRVPSRAWSRMSILVKIVKGFWLGDGSNFGLFHDLLCRL